MHATAGIFFLVPGDREFFADSCTNLFHFIVVFSADLLPCSWAGSWNLDPYSSNGAYVFELLQDSS